MVNDQYGTPRSSEVASIVERLGFGGAQIRQLIIGGGIWASDAAELLVIGSVTRALSKEWHISSTARGSAASIIFVGMGIGNVVSGPIGDRWGRKSMVLASYVGVLAFSCLSACTFNLTQMLFCRALVGISIGIGQPSWNALSIEMTPKAWHGHNTMASQSIFTIGECYALLLLYLDDPNLQDLDWRRLLIEAAMLPGFLLVLAFFMFKESPRFLASRGDTEGASKVLHWMRDCNGKPEVAISLTPAVDNVITAMDRDASSSDSPTWSSGVFAPLKIVFGRWLRSTTFLFGFSAFVLNFVFYGGLYAFPQVLPTMKMYSSPVSVLLMGIATEFPGFFIGANMTYRLNKRTAMVIYIFFCMVGQLPYAALIDGSSEGLLSGSGHGRVSVLTEVLLILGMITAKVSNGAGWIVVYTSVSQAYPTNCRTSGCAICLACGRLGSISAPIIYEVVLQHFHIARGFFVITGALCFLNLVLVLVISPAQKDAEEIEALKEQI